MAIQRHRWMHPGLALYRAFSLHPSTRHIHTSSLDTEILALSSWYSPLPHELLVRCHLPTLLFSNSLPQTAFRIHGSTSTRTCLPDSDLDLSISMSPEIEPTLKPAIFNSPIFASTQHRDRNLATLTHISKILSSLPLDTPKLIKSSTPHILTQDRQTLIPIDISLNTTTKRDIFISSLPFHYLSTFFAVKALLRAHGLNDASKGGIGSYALHLLIHHFDANLAPGASLINFLTAFINLDFTKYALKNGKVVPWKRGMYVEDPMDAMNNVFVGVTRVDEVKQVFVDALRELEKGGTGWSVDELNGVENVPKCPMFKVIPEMFRMSKKGIAARRRVAEVYRETREG